MELQLLLQTILSFFVQIVLLIINFFIALLETIAHFVTSIAAQ